MKIIKKVNGRFEVLRQDKDELERISNAGNLPKYDDLVFILHYICYQDINCEESQIIRNILFRATLHPDCNIIFKTEEIK